MTLFNPRGRRRFLLMLASILLFAGCSSGGDNGSTGLLNLNGTTTGPALTLTGPTQIGEGSTGSYVARLIGGDGKGVMGVPVTLKSSLGVLATASTDNTTDANGELAFTLTARTKPTGSQTQGDPITGTASLTGSAVLSGKTYAAALTVQFTPTTFTFTAPTSTAANPAKVPVNVRQTLSFQWFNNGIAVNAPVTFATSRGVLIDAAGNTASSLSVTTANGVASVDIVSTAVGAATVTATDGGSNSASLPLLFTGGTPATITLTVATPISSNGASTVSALVKDGSGNAVNGVSVDFALTGSTPAAGTLSRNSATTDPSGTASVVYNANGASGTATVQAAVGSVTPVSMNIVINN